MKLMLPGWLVGMPLSGPRGGWRRHAACRGEDPELFLPTCTTGPARARITAKAVCAAARSEACVRFGPSSYGVWGGLTEDERRKLRRRPRAAAARTQALRTAADWPDKDSRRQPAAAPRLLGRPWQAGRHRSRRPARVGQETVSRLG